VHIFAASRLHAAADVAIVQVEKNSTLRKLLRKPLPIATTCRLAGPHSYGHQSSGWLHLPCRPHVSADSEKITANFKVDVVRLKGQLSFLSLENRQPTARS
jgi:hypothetical protein